jgi:predicted house-cleaning noncanonical NTP pyrophosphatase (MazG superfamily)
MELHEVGGKVKIVYNKLVRDNIPKIITDDGRTATFRHLTEIDLIRALVAKLGEEGDEYLESLAPEEIADILEVVYGIISASGESIENIESIRLEKKAERGGFSEGIFLEHVESDT